MYNFISSNDLKKTILELNNIDQKDLNKEYDLLTNDDLFFNLKEKLYSLKDKRFLIVGDYDCDGISSTTIIKKLLNYLNINSNYYIPSRLKEGYGLNKSIVQKAIEHHFDVLFLLDNGITALEEIQLALDNGIEVLIIDHHECEELPSNCFILHPNMLSKQYQKLSAAGLCFVLSRLFYEDDLSLVLGALSQLSDITSVLGFNRFLIKEMMKVLKQKKISSFLLLNDLKDIQYDDLSFTIIPKINAISRMEPLSNPNYLVRYFLENEEYQLKYIETINYINEQRKKCSKEMATIATNLINGDDIEVLISKDFKGGLCGLLANRLVKQYDKSIVCLSKCDGLLKGSARAKEGVPLHELFKKYPHYETFGGHEGALGFTLKEEFEEEFKHFVKLMDVKSDIEKDAILLKEEDFNKELLNALDDLKPFGIDFKEPLLALLNNQYKKIIVGGKYPKYLIRNDLSAISFDENRKNANATYLIGYLKEDSYRKNNISFIIEDIL